MNAARSRPLVVVAGLAVAGIIMLSWTQTWFTVHLHAGAAVATKVDADGAAAVPQYTALAIASLALFLAMTIAGRVVRIVLACVEILLGLGVVVSGITALADPVAAAKGAVGEVAGVSDLAAVRRVVSTVDVSAWPAVGIAGGVLAVLLGVVVLVVQRAWPGPSRKYGAATAGAAADARAAAPVARDAVVDWDDLSAGVDPTLLDAPDDAVGADASGRGGSAGSGPSGRAGSGEGAAASAGAAGSAGAGVPGGAATDDTVGSNGRRSNDDAGTERGAP